ncbi:glycogen/starch/alpha-glucan phosphorylase [Thiocystis violascens]|uniref:Alpha-1,4 glucan phosphorylase n=1 Tax=Thiocystis violascens (strain ATCC 17096 / DSM 198 / 6111) TaxID=765911 RepID=I3YEU1_THIV6|nr:glycogen/starch/alpha-glucan phosphorylase [Thiocystis violascens]AFL75509.1 glycogen/starch/alpha-glucan phosphorylase [Thiocystis violascens DSM 198]
MPHAKRATSSATILSGADVRTGLDSAVLQQAVLDHLYYSLGRLPAVATPANYYRALALAIRDRLQQRWIRTSETYFERGRKLACYLSAEFLLGPHLGNNLLNLGLEQAAREALTALGQDLDAILDCEPEPGLGNGGLGRLAACYLDSLATLQYPAIGYGIRYEFGIFAQEIRDGWQTERTDKWLSGGNPWEIAKPDIAYEVKWGGHTERYIDDDGAERRRWVPYRVVRGIAYDTPIQGYGVDTCNTLRLWSAEAAESFDFQAFNTGDYFQAVDAKLRSETITKVLYPNDEPAIGKRLRLAQQYFFVTCSLQDMLRILDLAGGAIEQFAEHFAVQLNDTHPSIGVAELMRLLIDERGLDWDAAWTITVATFGYTNHTLLPEALETWPLPLFREVLPRHLEIIYEINRRFLDEVRACFPDDSARVARMSLIGEAGEKQVRMAHLACVGSHAINGVAALHSELLKASVLSDFHALWPERFSNKTNGVTPRRFLALANPGLRALLDETLGASWPVDLGRLRELESHIDDPAFRERWRAVKHANKQRLADYVQAHTGIVLDPDWLFDIQVKRIHEYKRQHLNLLHIVTLYQRLKTYPAFSFPPRAFLFGGKAAPGYFTAKRIIKLINAVAETINADPEVNGRLKVAFVPNFSVKNAQLIYPAADLSEQISTAGKEASGTGNMKFMLNGALTIGTLDGANVEMRDEVGAENFFLFGRTADEVARLQGEGYRPADYLAGDDELKAVMELIGSGHFSGGDSEVFRPLVENLTQSDPFLVLADYAAYVACQEGVSAAWADQEQWTRMSIINCARGGKFSSDRAIAEYAREIWGLQSVPIQV